VAAVHTHIGRGQAVLTGYHPEFIPAAMDARDPNLTDKLPLMRASDQRRKQAMAAILDLLGIRTKPNSSPWPRIQDDTDK